MLFRSIFGADRRVKVVTGRVAFKMVNDCDEEILALVNEAIAAERKWQGLTDEEIKEIIGPWGDQPVKGYTRKLFDQIEAKLKEKNNG